MLTRKLFLMGAAVAMLLPTLATADVCGSVPGNLIVNCGFETGDFTGWTLSGNTGFTGVSGNFSGINPNSGNFQAFFGPVGSEGDLSQTFATTAGTNYAITFFEAGLGGSPSEFSASFNGTTLLSQNPAPEQAYTEYSFTATATGPTSTLLFTVQNDPSYQLLDDVSVAPTTTPEPGLYVLLGAGLAGLIEFKRRRARTR
jgi:hypothetical protein